MGELHRALEVADLAGQHQPGTGHQILLDVFGVEEGGGDPWPTLLQRDDEVLPARRALGPADFGLLDLIDEGDVLAFLGRFVILAKLESMRKNRLAVFNFQGLVGDRMVVSGQLTGVPLYRDQAPKSGS